MAILSPALVLSMCVLFVLTRLQTHLYIFEAPLLFNLIYTLQPTTADLQALSTNKKASSLTTSSLPVRRLQISAQFFSASTDLPHHKHLSHLLSLFIAFLSAYLFEDIVSCFFPNLLSNTRSTYVAFFSLAFTLAKALHVSFSLCPPRFLIPLFFLSFLLSTPLVLSRDSSFVHLHTSFNTLSSYLTDHFANLFQMSATSATSLASNITIFSRVVLILLSSLIPTALFAPARFFASLDYTLYKTYTTDLSHHSNDPYFLGTPTFFVMFLIILDYVLPLSLLSLSLLIPRPTSSLPVFRLISLCAILFLRLATLRIRIQLYLDRAVDYFRDFWVERPTLGVIEAAKRTQSRVLSNWYHICLIVIAYVSPIVISSVSLLVAKLDGGVTLGFPLCKTGIQNVTGWGAEMGMFLSWWSMASWTVWATAGVGYEAMVDALGVGANRAQVARGIPSTSGKERRRMKRLMKEGGHKA